MARKQPRTRAKSPTQARSRATVEVLVQATTRVLLKEGYAACTTNKVAAEAGVSIGSLYQYFPNKEALVLAAMGAHQERLKSAMAVRLAELTTADLGTAVGEMIRAMLEVRWLQPKLQRVLFEQVPRVGSLKRLHEMHRDYEPMVTAWLEANRERLGVADPSATAYVLIGAVEGVVERVLVERPNWLEVGVLEDHLARLVLSYLSAARAT